MQNLVVVESPTKAKTLQKYLGADYQVEASMGHVRDLPKSELGVDIDNNFDPKYIIPRDKKKRVNELKKIAQGAKTIWLATDPDREGEAIAWHINHIFDKKKGEAHRVVFHEITEGAIKEAFKHPQNINLKLVDAQQARRVLDRLVGYKLSPLLWKKVKRGLSAGRVQSVALRLIVEREREIEAFKQEEYWSIEALLEKIENVKASFYALLIEKNGKKIVIKNEAQAKEHVQALQTASYKVEKVVQKEARRFPYPPFTTSTLQQTAAHKLGMSAKKIMSLAQALYERGFITYMRTDSVNLSVSAITSVRQYIQQEIGAKYVPNTPRMFKSKSKNAQEAHEAIRPTDPNLKSDQLKSTDGITRDHLRLYDLIWKRFVACQMSEAVVDQTTADIKASEYLLRASGSVIKFEGWLKLYGKETDEITEEQEEQKSKTQVLPPLKQDEDLKLDSLEPLQHFTQPPARYSEATLIKKLEELGIGRPSTYAPIISTIVDRYYVERENRRFKPTTLGFTVEDFLLEYFPDIINYSFTAQMEESLDEIARGEREWKPILSEFYTPFEKKIAATTEVAEKVKMEVEYTGKMCSECGKELIIRIGKFGKFLACSGFPECKHTESFEEKVDVKCPTDGGEIVVRRTRKGKTFYGCKNWPGCKFASWTKPKSETPA